MTDDAERFAAIDEVRVTPFRGRLSDKRTARGQRRYVRAIGTGFVSIAACGCGGPSGKPGERCLMCGGAALTEDEQRPRT